MVNAVVGIIFIIIIIIGAVVFMQIGNQLIDATQEFQQVLFTQIELREVVPLPMAFEDVCDLRVTVNGKIDQTLPLSELFVRLNHGDVSYAWFDCHPSTGIPLFSLLDFGKNSNADTDPLAFIFGDAQDLNIEVELKNFPSDPPVIKNKFLNPNLAKKIKLPSGSFPTPHPITQEFIITNLPDRNYKLTVDFTNTDIEGNGGDPFETNICKAFTVSC